MLDTHPNGSIIEAWNTVLFDKFTRYEHLLVDGLGAHGAELFRVAPPRPGAWVLDVGCGFGDTVVQLAGLVGPRGSSASTAPRTSCGRPGGAPTGRARRT